MSYDQILKKRIIKDFIKSNGRSPTGAEILSLEQAFKEEYTDLETKGLLALQGTYPKFLSNSSSTEVNFNRDLFLDDLLYCREELKKHSLALEDSYRTFRVRIAKLKKLGTYLESVSDDLLLALGLEDAFTSFFTEDFTGIRTTPNQNTTALIEEGYCIAPRYSLEAIDLTKSSASPISFTVFSDSTILSKTATSEAKNLYKLDGETYEYVVLLDKQKSTVNLVITISLPEKQDVGELRITSTNLRSHSEESYSVFYSTNELDYKLLEPGVRPYSNNTISISIAQSNVKSIRVVFTKTVADSPTTSFNQWAYGWQFDSIEVFKPTWASDRIYSFYGAYRLQDTNLDEDNTISKVTLDVCTIEPPGTGISWFVSGDNESWRAINPYGKALDIVSLRTRNTNALGVIDSTKSASSLLNPRLYSTGAVTSNNTWILNSYFSLSKLDPRSVEILLDVFTEDRDSGWNLNQYGNYEITVRVDAPEGKYINLGSRGAKLNGRIVSGNTLFPFGWSVFETATNNYIYIDSDAPDEDTLRILDPLYPFNHKYLIEGYEYDSSYSGARHYMGVDAGAGLVLRHREPDGVPIPWTWYADYMPGLGTVIYINVDPTASHFLDSTNSFSWLGVADGDNASTVYVKALLRTSALGATPMIDWFTIRGV